MPMSLSAKEKVFLSILLEELVDSDNEFLYGSDTSTDASISDNEMLFGPSTSSSSDENDNTENTLEKRKALKKQNTAAQQNFLKQIPRYKPVEFKNKYRISRNLFDFLVRKLKEHDNFKKFDTRVYSAHIHVAVFLYFVSHEACNFRDLAKRYNMSTSTISLIISRTVNFINGLTEETTFWPTEVEKSKSAAYFERNYGLRNVIGVLGVIHIESPCADQKEYINFRGDKTLQLQLICNEEHKFIDTSFGYPGSEHCQHIFENSDIYSHLLTSNVDDGHYKILAGAAYSRHMKHLITPNRAVNYYLNATQKKFNQRISICRHDVFRKSVLLFVQRFKQLMCCKIRDAEKLSNFIRACIVLHNLCDNTEFQFNDDDDDDDDDNDKIAKKFGLLQTEIYEDGEDVEEEEEQEEEEQQEEVIEEEVEEENEKVDEQDLEEEMDEQDETLKDEYEMEETEYEAEDEDEGESEEYENVTKKYENEAVEYENEVVEYENEAEESENEAEEYENEAEEDEVEGNELQTEKEDESEEQEYEAEVIQVVQEEDEAEEDEDEIEAEDEEWLEDY